MIKNKNDRNIIADNSFDKHTSYQYCMSDINLFDKRLFELIKEYPSLIIGTDWNYDRWIEVRQKMRDSVMKNWQKEHKID